MADDFVAGKTACIHLIYPNATGKIPCGRSNVRGVDLSPGNPGGMHDIACSPGSSLPKHASSEPAAVTCPTCKASKPFADLVEQIEIASAGASEADREAMRLAIEQRKQRQAELAAN